MRNPLVWAALLCLLSPTSLRAEGKAVSLVEAHGAQLNNQAVELARKGDFEQAVQLLRQAQLLQPDDLQIQKNLSGILTDWSLHLEQDGRLEQVVECLKEAVALDSRNAKALVLLGDWSYRVGGNPGHAVELWKRAYSEPGSAEGKSSIAQRISQAERDLNIERAFSKIQMQHFSIRFEGTQNGEGVGLLGKVLEEEYQRLMEWAGKRPELFSVIVYSNETFKRITGQKDWAIGLYDGRIRLRLDEIGTDRLRAVLGHELAHALLAQTYGPRLPIWVHEGFAQHCESGRELTPREEALMKEAAARTSWVPLRWLDRRFQQPSGLEDLERAYVQSRWAVENLIRSGGVQRFRTFLQKINAGLTVEQAFNQAFTPLTWAKADQGFFN